MKDQFNLSSGVIATGQILAANSRFDRTNPGWKSTGPMKPGWSEQAVLRRGRLTDRQIARYQERGWYKEDFKLARLEIAEKKARETLNFQAKQDNFEVRDGRLIYNPR